LVEGKAKVMKVRVHYSDGSYWMQAFPEAKAGLCIEIPDAQWLEYEIFLEHSKVWHMRMRDLDNQQYYLDHPEEQMIE
jgi:hypothetical protein